jgi:hypothetical protein
VEAERKLEERRLLMRREVLVLSELNPLRIWGGSSGWGSDRESGDECGTEVTEARERRFDNFLPESRYTFYMMLRAKAQDARLILNQFRFPTFLSRKNYRIEKLETGVCVDTDCRDTQSAIARNEITLFINTYQRSGQS